MKNLNTDDFRIMAIEYLQQFFPEHLPEPLLKMLYKSFLMSEISFGYIEYPALGSDLETIYLLYIFT